MRTRDAVARGVTPTRAWIRARLRPALNTNRAKSDTIRPAASRPPWARLRRALNANRGETSPRSGWPECESRERRRDSPGRSAAFGGAIRPAASRLPGVGLVAPLPPEVGGVASFAEWLLGRADEIGCTFVTFDLAKPRGETAGGRFRASALVRQARTVGRFLTWLPRAPRVVHLCVSYTSTGLARDVLLAALVRASGRRAIAHVHAGWIAPEDGAVRTMLRLVARLANETVAIAPTSAAALAATGVRAEWIMNPVRLAPVAEHRTSDTVSPGQAPDGGDALRVCFAGRYGRRKGTDVLIRAVAAARDDGVAVELRIAGKPEYADEAANLEALVAELGLDDVVRFEGIAGPVEMAALYASCDVFCLPSLREGLPMALLEAMAFGRPVVAARVGAVPDLVADAEAGLLVAPGSVSELRDGLVRLARDPDLRARLGEGARRRVGELAAPEALAARWRAVYEGQGLDLRPAA